MNQLQIFTNPEFGDVGMITTNGEPYFMEKDVADSVAASKNLILVCDLAKLLKQNGVAIGTIEYSTGEWLPHQTQGRRLEHADTEKHEAGAV